MVGPHVGRQSMSRSSILAFVHRAQKSKPRGVQRRVCRLECLEDRQLLSLIPTSTILSASASTVALSQSLTLQATVAAIPPGTGTPTGTVDFVDTTTGQDLGSSGLSGGVASLVASTPSPLAKGIHAIIASYSGDGSYQSSQTVVLPSSIITTYVGNGTKGFSGNNGPATAAQLNTPNSVAIDPLTGNLFFSDDENNRVRVVDRATGTITTYAGGGSSLANNIAATSAKLASQDGIAFDSSGNLYIADSRDQRVCKVNRATQILTIVAGTGQSGSSGDGGPPTAAELRCPTGMAFDAAGNLYIADSDANRIREVDFTANTITTFAGTGTRGYNGDGSLATAAELNAPDDVVFDAAGNLYICDFGNNRVRKIDASQRISTFAGDGIGGYAGDGGPAAAAELHHPAGMDWDAAGDLFIADSYNNVVRMVNHASGAITTVVGGGAGLGDGGSATLATLTQPWAVAFDAAGNLFIGDTGANRIRKVAPECGRSSPCPGLQRPRAFPPVGPSTATC